VTLEQTDQLLADWRKKIDFVSQNLIDLTSFPTYQRLTGVSGFPKVKLKGITEGLESDPLGASEDFNALPARYCFCFPTRAGFLHLAYFD